ncbi:MAG: helicase, partial [Desulfobacteraceae bacterium]
KASSKFDKERSPSLMKALMELSTIAKQRYFLAPNISSLNENPFTKGMEFFPLDFNTVLLNKHEMYRDIGKDQNKKSSHFLEILSEYRGKTLIYAGTYPDIDRVSTLILEHEPLIKKELLTNFADWLQKNYDVNWQLVNLINRGTGIHNGSLHRSLSQIQVKLFEEKEGLDRIISTSSIIEGVNTSAENVVIWRNKNGSSNINDFTYKNIIGRGGRMFRHFVGNAFILEQPPTQEATQLLLQFPDELIGEVDEEKYEHELSREQIIKIIAFKEEMAEMLGESVFKRLQREHAFKGSNSNTIKEITSNIIEDPDAWKGLGYLDSQDADAWDHFLYKIIRLEPSGWDTTYSNIVNFVKILSQNWNSTIPELLDSMSEYDLGIDLFFKLERKITFKLSSLLHNVNTIQREILSDNNIDISPFISKISYAFLPRVVFHLEEYGLPRMISKKIHNSGIFNFEDEDMAIHEAIDQFNKIDCKFIFENVNELDQFDKYIINYFYEGIRGNN